MNKDSELMIRPVMVPLHFRAVGCYSDGGMLYIQSAEALCRRNGGPDEIH